MDNQQMVERLKQAGISFESGMSDSELDSAENVFGFRFPREIRGFLSYGVPVGASFFNYRDLSENNLTRFRKFQESIEESFRFDLENDREDMLEMLGQKPGVLQCSESFDDAVIRYFRESPRLIPFFAHRCFFDGMDDMPIISFWQATDMIFYGGTFENYLEHEFLHGERVLDHVHEKMKSTGIWHEIIW